MQPYKGLFPFDEGTVGGWEVGRSVIGVYYCWAVNVFGGRECEYVGRAVGDAGIRGRLLQHLAEDKWQDVTHFGYTECANAIEAVLLETNEIARLKPKYNKIGK